MKLTIFIKIVMERIKQESNAIKLYIVNDKEQKGFDESEVKEVFFYVSWKYCILTHVTHLGM